MSKVWTVLVEEQRRFDSFTGVQRDTKNEWVVGDEDTRIALMCHGAVQGDANLVAAAPEMLEALETALDSMRSGYSTISQHNEVEALIKKARGAK